MTDVSYAPVDGMSATTVPKFNGDDILPQRIGVSLNIKVLHTKAPGWSESGDWLGSQMGPGNLENEFKQLLIDAKVAARDAAYAAADSEADKAAAAAEALRQTTADGSSVESTSDDEGVFLGPGHFD